MLFVASKLLAAVTQPLFWVGLLWLTGLVVGVRRAQLGRWLQGCGLVWLVALGFVALPDALLRPLENRFQVPDDASVARHHGLVVLGGATEHPTSYLAHGQVPLGEAAERLTVPLALWKRHPHLVIVYSGGEGRLMPTGTTEAELAQRFFEEQGVPRAQLRMEAAARNTRENAERVAQLPGDVCNGAGPPWLLVSSAWHLPRAEPEFARVGCRFTPYPVDYLTGDRTAWTDYRMAASLSRWQIALHEWLGLLVYAVSAP